MAATDKIAASEAVAGRLKLLANANRLRIMCRLLQGEVSVGDIETELDIRQPTLSREIAKLRDGGVIRPRRQSKVVFYELADKDMTRLLIAICEASSEAGVNRPSLAQQPAPAKPISFNARPKFAHKKRAAPSAAP